MDGDRDETTKPGARRYDSLSAADIERFRSWIPATGRERPRILEVGCASGNLSVALAERERGALLVGVDVEWETLVTFGGSALLADGGRPPFLANTFDLVIFSSALHHVLRVDTTLDEAVRILRPGGRLVLFEPNARHPLRFRIGSPIFRWPRLLLFLQGHLDPAFDPSELSAALVGRGLRTVCLKEFMPEWPSPGWRGRIQASLHRIASSSLPALNPWLLYVGEKSSAKTGERR